MDGKRRSLRAAGADQSVIDGAIYGYLAVGYNNGAWTALPGLAWGIISTAAAQAAPATYALGYADGSDGNVSSAPPGTIEVMFTRYGYANLSGTVDFADLLTLAQHYNSTTGTCDTGDFNYDQSIDFNDLLRLSQNYGMS